MGQVRRDGPFSIKSRLVDMVQPYRWYFVGFLIIAQLIPTLYTLSNTYSIGHLSKGVQTRAERYVQKGLKHFRQSLA